MSLREIIFRLFASKVLPFFYAIEHVLGSILLWTAIIIAVLLIIDELAQRSRRKSKKEIKPAVKAAPPVKEKEIVKEPLPAPKVETSPVVKEAPVVEKEITPEPPVTEAKPAEPEVITGEKDLRSWFSLQEDIAALSTEFKKECERKNVSFVNELDDRIPAKIHANKEWLNELIEELFAVALEQTRTGIISLKVKMVKANDKAGTAQILLTDTGTGLPASLLKAVQERDELFQFEDTLLQSVLLKLRKVKQSVENEKGRLTLATRAGQGSTLGILVEFGV